MKEINISYTISNTTQNVYYSNMTAFLEKLKEAFTAYDNISLYNEYIDDSYGYVSFSVNGMENIKFACEVSGTTFIFSVRRSGDTGSNNLARINENVIVVPGEPYTGIDGMTRYPYTLSLCIKTVEKNNKLIAILPYNMNGNEKWPVIFGKDDQERNYIYICSSEKIALCYDDPNHEACTCDLDNLTTALEGYVYIKRNIGIYKNGYIAGTTSQPVIICSTPHGTSMATYLNKICVNGIRYLQLRAMVWIEDD